MNITKFISKTLVTCVGLLVTNIAIAEVITASNGDKIYTDGFAIKSQTVDANVANSKQNNATKSATNVNTNSVVVNDATVIGQVGELDITTGNKPDGILAYVEGSQGTNYLIIDELLVKCQPDVACVANYKATRVGVSNLYNIPVTSYDEWERLQEELKEVPGVLKVMPKYSYGIKPSVN